MTTFEAGCADLVRCGVDYSLRQMAVLAHAARHPGQSVLDLAAALQINKPSVVRAIDRLALDGLVDRVQSTADRRKVKVSATTKGVRLLASAGTVLS